PSSRRKPGSTYRHPRRLKGGSRLSPGRRIWAVIAVTALATVALPGSAVAAGTVVIASKIDTEGALLGNMIAELVAARGIAVESPAALPGFEKTYGFHLKSHKLLTLSGGNTAATLRAAAEWISGVNAAMAYGTDGELAALSLTALCDDKGAQIVYAPSPVVRRTVLDQHPEIAAALEPAFASLSLETLQTLNARIAVAGEDAGAVAMDYLKSKHFLP